jgi:hypothetical protein
MMVGAGGAQAMTLTTGADPVESVPTQVAVSGMATSSSDHVVVTVKPAGGQTCAENAAADTGNELIATYPGAGHYSEQVNNTFETAGSYLLCSWTQPSGGAVTDRSSLTFSVRPPHLSIAISAPATVRPNQIFQVMTTAQAETERHLTEYLVPNTGDGCPANAAAASDTSSSLSTLSSYVDGGPSTASYNQSFSSTGSWLICAYFQYQSSSDPPEATASAALAVVRPPVCVVPHVTRRVSLTSFERRVIAAHCAVGRVTRAYSGSVPRGDVISVSPVPGKHLHAGTAIRILISAGPRPKHKRHRHNLRLG